MTPERRKYLTDKAREYREKKKWGKANAVAHDIEPVIDLYLGEEESVVDTATLETGGVTPEPRPEVHRTRTDRLFEIRLPGYYIYGSEKKERACWKCGEAFTTRMELNKFCSPRCKDGYLDEAVGRLKGVKK